MTPREGTAPAQTLPRTRFPAPPRKGARASPCVTARCWQSIRPRLIIHASFDACGCIHPAMESTVARRVCAVPQRARPPPLTSTPAGRRYRRRRCTQSTPLHTPRSIARIDLNPTERVPPVPLPRRQTHFVANDTCRNRAVAIFAGPPAHSRARRYAALSTDPGRTHFAGHAPPRAAQLWLQRPGCCL